MKESTHARESTREREKGNERKKARKEREKVCVRVHASGRETATVRSNQLSGV